MLASLHYAAAHSISPPRNTNLQTQNGIFLGWPGNPMITNPYQASQDLDHAYTFFVRNCSSSSLGLHDTPTNKNGWQSIDYIQIINPVTGHCMTWEQYGQPSNISFVPCIHTPDTPVQLFSAGLYFVEDAAIATLGWLPRGIGALGSRRMGLWRWCLGLMPALLIIIRLRRSRDLSLEPRLRLDGGEKQLIEYSIGEDFNIG